MVKDYKMPRTKGQPADRCFDLHAALERCAGDWEILYELAELFCQQSPQVLQEIADALHRADSSAVERMVHRLKGSIGNFAAPAAFEAAQRLENAAANGDLVESRSAWSDLSRVVADLQQALGDVADADRRTRLAVCS
jgi:HPt (histidine-containing phosphotransfer) domain-containing protein